MYTRTYTDSDPPAFAVVGLGLKAYATTAPFSYYLKNYVHVCVRVCSCM